MMLGASDHGAPIKGSKPTPAVIVVHGVGSQVDGETAEDLTRALARVLDEGQPPQTEILIAPRGHILLHGRETQGAGETVVSSVREILTSRDDIRRASVYEFFWANESRSDETTLPGRLASAWQLAVALPRLGYKALDGQGEGEHGVMLILVRWLFTWAWWAVILRLIGSLLIEVLRPTLALSSLRSSEFYYVIDLILNGSLILLALGSALVLIPPRGYVLRLMHQVDDVRKVPMAGKRLVVIADIKGTLHFRILGGDGKLVVDTDEKSLTERARQDEGLRKQLEDLRKLLEGKWSRPKLTEGENRRIITAITSIVDSTRLTRSENERDLLATRLVVDDAPRRGLRRRLQIAFLSLAVASIVTEAFPFAVNSLIRANVSTSGPKRDNLPDEVKWIRFPLEDYSASWFYAPNTWPGLFPYLVLLAILVWLAWLVWRFMVPGSIAGTQDTERLLRHSFRFGVIVSKCVLVISPILFWLNTLLLLFWINPPAVWDSRYQLRLMKQEGDMPKKDQHKIFVAGEDKDKGLHFRIFGSADKPVVDTGEKSLTERARQDEGLRKQLEDLKKLLEGKWSRPKLTEGENRRIITAVTSIFGLTPDTDGVTKFLAALTAVVAVPFTAFAACLLFLAEYRPIFAPPVELALDVINYYSPLNRLDEGPIRRFLRGGRRAPADGRLEEVLRSRLRALIGFVRAEHQADVLIVAHSLGAVIAVSALRDWPGACEAAEVGACGGERSPEPFVRLVTMGCPLPMLTAAYPEHYGPKGGEGCLKLPLVADWWNYYRNDDVIGRELCFEAGGIVLGRRDPPKDKEVGRGGHAGYFADAEVAKRLVGVLKAD